MKKCILTLRIVRYRLSHVILAPFGLSSIVGDEHDITSFPTFLSPEMSKTTPKVIELLLGICTYYLETSGKQMNAAALLLARLGQRNDLQQLNLGELIMKHAVQSLTLPQTGMFAIAVFYQSIVCAAHKCQKSYPPLMYPGHRFGSNDRQSWIFLSSYIPRNVC